MGRSSPFPTKRSIQTKVDSTDFETLTDQALYKTKSRVSSPNRQWESSSTFCRLLRRPFSPAFQLRKYRPSSSLSRCACPSRFLPCSCSRCSLSRSQAWRSQLLPWRSSPSPTWSFSTGGLSMTSRFVGCSLWNRSFRMKRRFVICFCTCSVSCLP